MSHTAPAAILRASATPDPERIELQVRGASVSRSQLFYAAMR